MKNSGADDVIIEIAGLSVKRGRTRVLDGIDWRVERGQHWVILGANGSGKTSLLKVLCGYLTSSAGEVRALGAEYGRADWRQVRRRVGLVSAALQAAVPDHESALETVVSGRTAQLDLWEAPTAREALEARRLLRRVGAVGLGNRPWGVLSQGERQRVLLARALMARPALLILDEPCAGLDPIARERFLADLENLLQRPDAPAVALVTHHVEEIVPGFSHALLLRAGTVVASGPLAQTLTGQRLSQVFDARAVVRRRAGRWSLAVTDAPPQKIT